MSANTPSPLTMSQPDDSVRRLPPARHRVRPPRPATPGEVSAPTEVPLAAEPAQAKRGRGRPRIHPLPTEVTPKKDYEVGYGKPPMHTRFQSGRSGNPAGRPKGSRSVTAVAEDVLYGPITARINGKTVTMTKLQAIIERRTNQALEGDRHAVAQILKLMERVEAHRQPDADLTDEDRTRQEADEAIVLAYLKSQGWGIADDAR